MILDLHAIAVTVPSVLPSGIQTLRPFAEVLNQRPDVVRRSFSFDDPLTCPPFPVVPFA